ncbi:D-aminoacyl-tRNA deacylase [Persicirhabdus sediminis]|uniref:D-aminoacyl-tRNA deacylase n=1 Tax=Persicirhabdus sediminis TaxID=454144 RepID=A0A8J7MDR7_9BACT|nr:D-aminoacyl-tRNA deacylase [Persicirhabdus sediminis]MBK1790775.1 D-tyrosyl-tRNA(Tyr) deacylase [Persicirhabdus sediminis]
MRVIIQRVSQAKVEIEGEVAGQIGSGFAILLGIEEADGLDDVNWLCGKISKMRIFGDDEGKMNRSLMDVDGEVLVISQFTLHASTKKGNRPSFIKSARPDHAMPLYEAFKKEMSQQIGKSVASGRFGAEMQVTLTNDGPVTITMDSQNRE